MSKIVKIGISVAVAAALIVGGVKAIQKAKAENANIPKAKIYPVVVSQISPASSDVKLTLPYLAEIGNDKDVEIAARIAARVLSIKASGSDVKKGDLIVTLDTTEIQSSLKSLKDQIQATNITLENLNKTHQRTLELLNVHGASIEESQKEESAIAGTQASLNTLKQKEIELNNALSYATISSPVDGVIAKTFVNKGAVSAPSKPLVAMSAKNGFYLMVRVPSDISVKDVILKDRSYKAIALGSTLNGLAEYKVYIDYPNLTTGDRVEVSVVVYDQKDILLPFDAVLNVDGKSYVFEIEKDKAVAKEVHIVQSAQEGVVIQESLEGKKIVVAKPDILLKLTSGYRLQVKE
ncbi:MAG: biotin/lipoyl-binding protein [Sulfurimonas sp.]|jgi:multidrug efflux pump subunit AcrA (membrane-fusion protein)